MSRPGLLWPIFGLIAVTVLLLAVNDDSGTLFGMANGDFAALMYGAVLAMVFGAAVLARRQPWGDMLRNALLWMLIVFVLVAGYVYRYELQDIGARLSGGLLPGSPVAGINADGRPTITLVGANDGHFRARGSVNGEAVDFLVDTGASVVVLSERDAERVGIDTATLSYSVPVNTANGIARAARVTLDRLAIGTITRHGIEAMVTRRGTLQSSLLGMNYLSSLSGFEIRGDRMILTD